MIKLILNLFADVTGLVTNLSKSHALPIRYGGFDLDHILRPLNISVKDFPCKYLGMPLSLQQLRKENYRELLKKNRCPPCCLERLPHFARMPPCST
jgi:hypothetical protein